MEVFEIIGLLIAGAAGLINYVQNRRRREMAEELPEEGDEDFFPFPEDVLQETDQELETIGREWMEPAPVPRTDSSPLEEVTPKERSRKDSWAELQEKLEARTDDDTSLFEESSLLSSPITIMVTRPKKSSSSRLATKKRVRQAIIDAEIFAPPISKRKKGPFSPLSRPV
jgi:hypothetical protein